MNITNKKGPDHDLNDVFHNLTHIHPLQDGTSSNNRVSSIVRNEIFHSIYGDGIKVLRSVFRPVITELE